MQRTRRLALAPVLLAMLAGCRADPPPAASPAAREAYAPFTVTVDGPHWFHTVTFKDVGLRAPSDADRQAIIEAIGDAFAHRLSRRVPAHLDYDPTVAEPVWHTQCRGHHLYVDLWRSSGPDRVGFSLWKGCGADDRVAWVEVPAPPSALESPGWLDVASRLGETIADAAMQRCPHERCG
jgi:hypothetical protein